jgi:molybdopterin-containing oxidoreductase family iron-sulfur binding subunit
MQRRKFLKTSALAGAAMAGVSGLPLLHALRAQAGNATTATGGRRWGMVIDLTRCPPGCNACVGACKQENNVVSSGDGTRDVFRIRKVTLRNNTSSATKGVPLLCNHCDNPPCAQVCPIKATYKRADGIVIVDPHRCMGCRYCLIACPYNARHFNFRESAARPNPAQPKRQHGVAESCDLCAHLLDQGKPPACVTACAATGARAIRVGNLDDPGSEVAMLIREHSVKRLREKLGTEPKVYYIGL